MVPRMVIIFENEFIRQRRDEPGLVVVLYLTSGRVLCVRLSSQSSVGLSSCLNLCEDY